MKSILKVNVFRTEIVPFETAPWTASSNGASFIWAWRILDYKGDVRLLGASNAAEHIVHENVEKSVQRLELLQNGDATNNVLQTRLPKRHKITQRESGSSDDPS